MYNKVNSKIQPPDYLCTYTMHTFYKVVTLYRVLPLPIIKLYLRQLKCDNDTSILRTFKKSFSKIKIKDDELIGISALD